MVLVEAARARDLHSDAHTPEQGECNNVVQTCASSRRAYRSFCRERRKGAIDEFTRKRTNPEIHGALSAALCHRYANWTQLA